MRLSLYSLVGAAFLLAGAAYAEPELYVQKDTWAETMQASRAALLAHEAASGTQARPVKSELLRGGMEPQKLVLDVAGAQQLWLKADIGPDTYNCDQAVWGNPRLRRNDGVLVALGELAPISVAVGYGKLIEDKDHLGKPLQVGAKRFRHGFWAHAPSLLGFQLGGEYKSFSVYAGIGSAAGTNGSAHFHLSTGADYRQSLWNSIKQDFPSECAVILAANKDVAPTAWFKEAPGVAFEKRITKVAIEALGDAGVTYQTQLDVLREAKTPATDPQWLALSVASAQHQREMAAMKQQLELLNLPALRLAVVNLMKTSCDAYPKGADYLAALDAHAPDAAEMLEEGRVDEARMTALLALQREALLANPLIDFDELLVVRRSASSPSFGLPCNWQSNSVLPKTGYDNTIAALNMRRPDAPLRTVFKPEKDVFVGDVELHYDADKMLFSMSDPKAPWQVYETDIDGQNLRKVSWGDAPDVDNYDACYLPDGRVIYGSTAPMRAVPCVDGSTHVSNAFLLSADRSTVRQLGYDQEHNWCPAPLPNGRVLYLRWEYSGLPHSNSRILFSMNPDGTNQAEYYGSNSFWPNGIFYARPIPGHPTKVVGIATGHHGVRRMGEMIIYDPAAGRQEADGAIHRIPECGKEVEPVVRDQLADASWPKFLHPYPLSEDYFLVSAQPTPQSAWGIYLVDTFDNMLLLREEPGYVLFEPVPLKKRAKEAIVPERVDLERDDSLVYLANVYAGGGLKGVPKGAVKELRLFTYNYSYRGMGGLLGVVGMDGPWDVKRVLGTVPVEEDGSAFFRVPANTPISIQPLDEDGRALQVMRSWFTGMPGENVSCVGCHEQQNSGPPSRNTVANYRQPSEIAPWRGVTRGFSFAREVQPVLDKHCLGCHDGDKEGRPDLRGDVKLTDWRSVTPGQGGRAGGQFSIAYAHLHKFVRRPGIESDIHMLTPLDFHASQTELVQMLEQGHHGVELDAEAWDRINTWIDLNTPFHGYWHEIEGDKAVKIAARASELAKEYGGNPENPEIVTQGVAVLEKAAPDTKPLMTAKSAVSQESSAAPNGMPVATGEKRTLDLGNGESIEMVLIPAGAFTTADGQSLAIPRPFWMSVCEVTNGQYAAFDARHDSWIESKHAYQFGVTGFPLNEPEQPVVRVSWESANGFCDWLSGVSGESVGLPSEMQWEYACRAGSPDAFSFGGLDADFSAHANLADKKLREFADNPYQVYAPLAEATPYDDWIPRDDRFNDNVLVTAPVGQYQANAFGLYDMHGNVWEWTRPAANDEMLASLRTSVDAGKVPARGGSWYDRPKRATASYRIVYAPWQKVFNVGFRIIIAADEGRTKVARKN